MSHQQQKDFVKSVKDKYPDKFKNARVLEVGSYNINGTIRDFFENCEYTGIDVCPGPGVDHVCSGHIFKDQICYDTIITCEMLEHNLMWKETILNIVNLLCNGGLFVLTCATTGRSIHGTSSDTPENSPSFTIYGNYYKNLTEIDIREVIDLDDVFLSYGFETCEVTHDLYMWGIKK